MSDVTEYLVERLRESGMLDLVRAPFEIPYALESDYYRGMQAAAGAREYAALCDDDDERDEALWASWEIEHAAEWAFRKGVMAHNGNAVCLSVHKAEIDKVLNCMKGPQR